MSDLIIKYPNIPLRGYPEEELNTIILGTFLDWICVLLSLTGESSKERLKMALPAVKDHCISMGFEQVKEMFEMYADGKLKVKPIPNYFDRILVGQIFNAYKSETMTKPKKIDADQAKADQDILYTIQAFDFFIQERELPIESYWLYDYFEEKGLIKYTAKEKIAKYKVCQKHTSTDEHAKEMAKVRLVEDFFKRLEVKNEHVKELI